MRLFLFFFIAVLSSGCTKGLYHWGGYNKNLYNYYQDPSSAESFMVRLESHLGKLEVAGRKPAPGLYAELGTLYLQKGDRKRALVYYAKEQSAWTESKHMMSVLIANLSTEKSETTAIKD